MSGTENGERSGQEISLPTDSPPLCRTSLFDELFNAMDEVYNEYVFSVPDERLLEVLESAHSLIVERTEPILAELAHLTEKVLVVCDHTGTPSSHKKPNAVLVALLGDSWGWDNFGLKGYGWALLPPYSNKSDRSIRMFDYIDEDEDEAYDHLDATITLKCDRCGQTLAWRHLKHRDDIGKALDGWSLAGKRTMTLKELRYVIGHGH